MAFVYEVNGQRVEFEREPTEADIDEAAKSIAPRPQPASARPAPVEGSGGAAFGVYPQAGRRPEAQQDREAAKEMALQTARGVVTGTLGAIPDILNIPGSVYSAATGNEPGYRIPGGSEDLNRLLPGQVDTPQARLARFGGEALSPVPALRTAQAVGRGTQAVGGAVKATAQAPFQAGKGAFNAATGGETALAPLGKTYVTPEGAELFRQGRIDIATLESPLYTRPIDELATGALDRAALKVAGNQIPLAGRGAQAFGERVMSDYIANPYKAAVDIGLPFITGGVVPPIYALGRGLQAAADMRLAGKGFDPGLQQQVSAAKTQQAFQPPQPQAPRLGYNPTATGPVNPTTMYSGAGGTSADLPAAGQAALNTKYPPMPASAAPAAPAGISQTPQQMAAARIQPSLDPARQAALDKVQNQIRARGETEKAARVAALQSRAAAAGGYTPPRVEAPVAPVAPAVVPTAAPAPTLPTAMPAAAPANTLDQLRTRLTPMTAEQQAAVDVYNAKTPADKARQTRAEKIAKTPAPVVKSAVPTKTSDVLKANEGRAAVQAALDSGEPATIKYKTSTGIITEKVNQSINFKPDADLALTHRIDRPDHSNTLFGTEKSSGKPIKVEITDLSARENNPEYIKVFDNSNPKSPVLIKTYDLNGTLTSTPSVSKKAPPGTIGMIPESGGAKSLATQFPENYKYNPDLEKHFHGFDKPLTAKEYADRRFINEVKHKDSAQTYRVKEGDTVKTIAHDGPDLTISVANPETGNKIDYVKIQDLRSKQVKYRKEVYTPEGAGVYDQWTDWSTVFPKNWPTEFKNN